MAGFSQTDTQCPDCAGQCVFDPGPRALHCQSCGNHHAIAVDPVADPAEEFHYHPDMPHTEQKVVFEDHPHRCQTCGGTTVFTGAALSEACAYCNGALIRLPQEQAFDTLGLIPFAFTATDATLMVNDWIARRWAAPNDLGALIAKGTVAGIYVPFWTFDSDEAVDYIVRYRTGSGKNRRTRTTKGRMTTWFDDMLVPASPHVTPLIRDGILHDFNPAELRPYTPAYLAGFAAERHHQTVTEGLRANADDKDLLLRNRIKHHSGKSRITSVSYKTHTTGIHYRRILLPVWILHYTYGGASKKVVVCGLHGRTFGERPFSLSKLLTLSAAITAATMAFGWLWGAAGML